MEGITLIPEAIELRPNNPYSIGEVFVFNEGDYLLERNPISPEKSIKDRYYKVVQGDTLSGISFFAYGNSKWWWVLEDVNNLKDGGFMNMLELTPGIALYIPDLSKLQSTLVD